MQYNLQRTTSDGRMAIDVQYEFPQKLESFSQYKVPTLLNNSGICKAYSLAFEDIANKLGIPCRVVTGYTGMEYAWNIVLINGKLNMLMQHMLL